MHDNIIYCDAHILSITIFIRVILDAVTLNLPKILQITGVLREKVQICHNITIRPTFNKYTPNLRPNIITTLLL